MKFDKTLSYFTLTRPDAKEHFLPIQPSKPHILSPGTLCWSLSQGNSSWEGFCQAVSQSDEKTCYFLDTCFFDRKPIPLPVIEALLTRRIVITSSVWLELSDWIKNPFENCALRDSICEAREKGNASVLFIDDETFCREIKETVGYYVALLGARKGLGVSLREEMSDKEQRPIEIDELTKALQKHVGSRGADLARKSLQESTSSTADEDLVVSSVVYSIVNVTDTVIVTRDRDVLEQFRRFIFLLDTHYRSHLVYDCYEKKNAALIEHRFIPDEENAAFETTESVLLDLPRRFVDSIVPKNMSPINASCCRIAGPHDRMKVANLTFSLVEDMAHLLAIKGIHGGKNIATPSGDNCHILQSPPFKSNAAGNAIIARDKSVEVCGFRGPLLDLEYALQERQGFRRAEIYPESAPLVESQSIPSAGAKLADFFLHKWLAFSSSPRFDNLESDELLKAIQFFDAASFFYLDRHVLLNSEKPVRKALYEKSLAWGSDNRDEAWQSPAFQGLDNTEKKQCEKAFVYSVPEAACYGYEYYYTLLTLRRQFSKVIQKRIEAERGRTCDQLEAEAIAEHYGGIRARRIAKHYSKKTTDPLFYSSDDMLVQGMISSIRCGTDVVFLTQDPTVLDQFGKLCSILRNDYLSYLYGDRFLSQIQEISKRDIVRGQQPDTWMEYGPSMQIDRWRHDGAGISLQGEPYLINCHCWLIGEKNEGKIGFAAWTFCADRNMYRMLDMKTMASGANIMHPQGLNIRVGHTDRPNEFLSLISDERMVRRGSNSFPIDERTHTSVECLSAIDVARVFMNNEHDVALPWYECRESL